MTSRERRSRRRTWWHSTQSYPVAWVECRRLIERAERGEMSGDQVMIELLALLALLSPGDR